MNTSSCVVFVVLFVLKTTDCASSRSTSSSQDESGLSHEAGQVHSTTGGSNLLNQTEPSLTEPSLTEPRLTRPDFAPESNTVCGVTEHNSRFGFITSPNYPRSYDNNQTCLWSIQAPAGHVCYVIFNAFDLEPGPDHSRLSCPFDFLHIFEEFQIEPDNPELVYRHSWGTYCGRNRPPRRSSARPGSTLYFYFRSDVSRRGKGFVLNYQMMVMLCLCEGRCQYLMGQYL
ncbi:neuropilin-2-like [Clavelina lepadiformis]|uniref:neuropilin-2-like n=1 Tax=Clavelina lepadiformis TaxID=159417 RepID=UPI004042C76A